MSKLSEPQTRERILAYLTVAHALLACNPAAALSSIARQAGLNHGISAELIELGVLSVLPDGAGHKWESVQTIPEVADLLILHRRKQAAPAPSASTEELLALREQLTRQAKYIEELGTGLAELRDKVASLPNGPAKLAPDDAELLRLAVNDDKNNTARIAQLEKTVGEILYRVGHAPLDKAGPAAPARPLKIALLGLHQRDLQHVVNGVRDARGPASRSVDFFLLDHLDPHVAIPTGTDAVIATPDAAHRAKEARAKWPGPIHQVSGGIKSVVAQVATLARAA